MYVYDKQRSWVFTEDGQVMFLRIRDAARDHIADAGAVRCDKLMAAAGSGDSWNMLACVDRLVELGEIREVTDKTVPGQLRIFTLGAKSDGI